MKKAIILAGAFAIIGIAAVGCDVNGAEVPDPVVGTWNGVSWTLEGVTTLYSDSGGRLVLTIDADGSFTFVRTPYMAEPQSYRGSWRRNGSDYVFAFVGSLTDPAPATISGDELRLFSGSKLYLLERP